jgi:hypothetical protein
MAERSRRPDRPATPAAEQGRAPADAGDDVAQATPEVKPAPPEQKPEPLYRLDPIELERLRARLIAKQHGRT